ncbi:MAG: hypothetical protein U0L09_01300 [Christensenellales bacterium]|nr:hypothetical protein [Christensenellales bacterium]
MRTKQAFMNASFSLMLQVALAISGLLVPRFFIAVYGSAINGLVSSVTQFITYLSLVEAGVGAASTVALYKPLAARDSDTVSGILSATRVFYLRSGLIFVGLVGLLVVFYPHLVNGEIQDSGFVRFMIILLSLSGIIDYFVLGKYRVLLMADQRGYVLYGFQIIGTIVMTALNLWQIHIGCSALIVKATAAGVFIGRSIAAIVYCKRRYKDYQFNVPPLMGAFTQRNAALVHQIVGVIANNAAVVLLTVMVKRDALAEVSVYSVYNLVAYSLSTLLSSLTTGLTPSFGSVISKGEEDVLRSSYGIYEMVMFLLVFTCYICMALLLYPFVALYSMQFADGTNYVRTELVLLFTLSGLLQSVRYPALTLICAGGHYKQTQGRAIIELGISLTFSLALTPKFGIVGVMVAMCMSYLYRTTDVIVYSAKHFLKGTLKNTGRRLLRNAIVMGVLIAVGIACQPHGITSWVVWITQAILVGTAAVGSLFLVNYVCEPQEMKGIIRMCKGLIRRSR